MYRSGSLGKYSARGVTKRYSANGWIYQGNLLMYKWVERCSINSSDYRIYERLGVFSWVFNENGGYYSFSDLICSGGERKVSWNFSFYTFYPSWYNEVHMKINQNLVRDCIISERVSWKTFNNFHPYTPMLHVGESLHLQYDYK